MADTDIAEQHEDPTVKAVLANITAIKQFQNDVAAVKDDLKCVKDAKANATDTALQTQLMLVKERYSMLKKKVNLLQLTIQMTECVRESKMATIQQEDTSKCGHALDGLKQEIAEYKEKITELCNENTHFYELYLVKLELLRSKIEQLESKVCRYKELSSRATDMPELLSQLQSEDQVNTLKETLENDLVVVASEQNEMAERISREERMICDAEEVLRTLQEVLVKLDEQLDQQMQAWTDKQDKCLSTVTWLEGALECLHTLSGIESVLIEDTSLVVRFSGVAQSQTAVQETDMLSLTINFSYNKRGHFCLAGAQVDLYHLDISDFVATAVMRDDIEYLVSSVNERWHKMSSLHGELEALRERYAIDWVPEEEVVRVLFGSSSTGVIVCMLNVEPGYPHAGHVKMQSITGLPKDTHTQQYNTLPVSASLTDWCSHLHASFNESGQADR